MRGMAFVPIRPDPGRRLLRLLRPAPLGPELTAEPRRVLYVTYNRASEGDHRLRYYADKRKSYPPDCEREPGKQYVYRV
jgi:hypothetical protein